MYDHLPGKLKQRDIFCKWKKVMRNGRYDKLPFTVQGRMASSTDRQCFTDFETICESLDGYDGIGIGIFDDLVAIDIDHCVTNGVISDMAQDIISTMNCYTEYSPSGSGIRMICTAGSLSYDKTRYYINNHKLGLEVYVAGYTNKFVTLTGNTIRECDLIDRRSELMTVLDTADCAPSSITTEILCGMIRWKRTV